MNAIDLHGLFSELDQRAMTPIISPIHTPSTSKIDLRRFTAEEMPSLPTVDQANEQKIHSFLMSLPPTETHKSPSISRTIATTTNEDFTTEPHDSKSSNDFPLSLIETDEHFKDFLKSLKSAMPSHAIDFIPEQTLYQLALKKWMLSLIEAQKKLSRPKPKRQSNCSILLPSAGSSTSTPKESNPTNSNKNSSKRLSNRIQTKWETPKTDITVLDNSDLQDARDKAHANKVKERLNRAAEKAERENNEFLTYFMPKYPKLYIFKGLQRELVCKICRKPTNLIKCETVTCQEHVHAECAQNQAPVKEQSKNTITHSTVHVTGEDCVEIPVLKTIQPVRNEPILCPHCTKYRSPVCFLCKIGTFEDSILLRCSEKPCGRYYHMGCLQLWPQAKVLSEYDATMICPAHYCHTCSSDDPRGKHYHTDYNKLTKCVQCLATYHMDSCCIPAGSELLTARQIICPRHRIEVRKPINSDWCFICAIGGKLVCCETCPMAFHAECLGITPPDKYTCEECETGRMPLYGELVWAKIPKCRWWPSIIVPPWLVPDRVKASKHQTHDICIRYFGANNFGWISRNFIFLYQDNDTEYENVRDKKDIPHVYQNALHKAQEFSKYFAEMRLQYSQPKYTLRPLPYIKIKTNKPIPPVRLNDVKPEQCKCDPNGTDPCGPNSGCINRVVLFECDPELCKAGKKCQNQMFSKQEYPKLQLKHMGNRGFGLISVEDIKRDSFIIEYVGELINFKENNRRLLQKHKSRDEHFYFLYVSRDLCIDAGPRGNDSRFMNHSCDPNCDTQFWTVNGNERVGLFAVKDIPAVS